jgi:hypothetical protein
MREFLSVISADCMRDVGGRFAELEALDDLRKPTEVPQITGP